MYIQRSSIVPRSVSSELEGVRLCPGRLPWLPFQWSLPQRHTTLPAGACLSAPARGLRVNPREWLQVVCIRFISVPFPVVCLVDSPHYTRSTNIAQAGLMKALETLGFIGVSRNAYLAHIRPIGGACQARRGRGTRHAVVAYQAVSALRVCALRVARVCAHRGRGGYPV